VLKPKNTIAVVYPPGGYGTFLHWAIEYFSGMLPADHRPFTDSGSAHLFEGATLDRSYSEFTTPQYLQSSAQYLVARSHGGGPHDTSYEDKKYYISRYSKFFKHTVNLVRSEQCHLMLLHNVLTKTPRGSYGEFYQQTVDRYQEQFEVKQPVPTWQLREMLSYRHGSDIYYTREYYQSVAARNNINIAVVDLVSDFSNTLKTLLPKLGLCMLRQDELPKIETEWLSRQKFTKVDSLCQHIVESVVQDKPHQWDAKELTVIDEAYVQYLLRQQGIEIRCFGLDNFPCDSVQLQTLIYRP